MARRNLRKEDVQRLMLELNIKDDVPEKNVDLVRDKLIKSSQFNNIQMREQGKLSNVKRFMLNVKVMKYKNFKSFNEFKWIQDRDGDYFLEVTAIDGNRPDFKSVNTEQFHFNAMHTVEIHRVKNEYVHLKFKHISDNDIDNKFIFRDPDNSTFKTEFERRFDCTIDFVECESETESVDDGKVKKTAAQKRKQRDEDNESVDDDIEPQASTSAAVK